MSRNSVAASGRPGVLQPGTRPRNRRDLILSAASDLFYREGYPAVGMGDIAAAVSVQPSALYRHFPSKQRLLYESVRAAVESGVQILANATQGDLDHLLTDLAEGALDHRRLGILWQRESRHLAVHERNEIRERLRTAMTSLRAMIEEKRPDLDRTQAEFLAWCAFAVLISVSYQQAELPRADYVRLLRDMTLSVINAPIPPLVHRAAPAAVGLGLSSRREKLLAASMTLFAERGYEAVGVDDIAAAAGIATPSFYHHFSGKADLLWATLSRGNEAMRMEMTRSLRAASNAEDGLRRVMCSYIALALDSHELIEALISQISYLPSPERQRAKEFQLDLVDEWIQLFRTVHHDVGRPIARVRVQAALTVVNDIACTPHIRSTGGATDSLHAVSTRLLGL